MTNTLMFIIHSDTLSHELEMSSVEKEGSLFYHIQQKQGGPTIDFYSPGMIEMRDKEIGPGFLANHAFYYHKKEKVYLTQTTIDFFNMLRRFIKKESKRVKLKTRSFWIGDRSIDLCKKDNYSLVEINGNNLLKMVE